MVGAVGGRLIDLGTQSLAASAIQAHLELLNSHIDKISLDGPAIHIHQTRVACRRFRALLKSFSCQIPAEQASIWNKNIRKLMRTLGMARDLEVQLLSLRDFENSEPQLGLRPGLRRLNLRLSQSRQAMHPKIMKAVTRFHSTDTVEALGRLAEEWRVDEPRFNAAQSILPSEVPGQLPETQLSFLLKNLIAFDSVVADPSHIKGHHDMRIAAKRLRYGMEVFLPVRNKAYADFVKTIKKIQSQLGQVHDCDVWCAYLSDFIVEEAARHRCFHGHLRGFSIVKQSLMRFAEHKAEERDRSFSKFAKHWEKLQAEDSFGRLQTLLGGLKLKPME